MPKFLITLPQLPIEEVKKAWAKVKEASVGSSCTMDYAFVKKNKEQAVCCWEAPDRDTIVKLFSSVGLVTESVEEVEVFSGT